MKGRDIDIPIKFLDTTIRYIGFRFNYKWVQGFTFEGSLQFTGLVPSYGVLDVQLNKEIPKIYSTFKIGVSNLLNNKHYEVYGGPYIGRMAYFSIRVELGKK